MFGIYKSRAAYFQECQKVFNKCAVRRQWDTFQLCQKHLPRSIWGKVPGVKLLFPRKRLERRVGALSPDVFGFHFQVFRPNTAERFGCSRLVLRSIQSYEEETTKPTSSNCAGVATVWVIASFSANCSRSSSLPSPPLHTIFLTS